MPNNETENYTQFIDKLAQNEQFPKLTYYSLILRFADDILLDIENSSQTQVAEKLKIPQSKLSTISSLLKAYTLNDRTVK